MKDKQLVKILLGLNLALAVAFLAYVFIANRGEEAVHSVAFEGQEALPGGESIARMLDAAADTPAETAPEPEVAPTAEETPADASSQASVPAPAPKPAGRQFGWQDVETESYRTYVDNLKLVGCPEDKLQYIILKDINDLFAQKRLDISKKNDQQWWQVRAEVSMTQLMREKGMELEDQRIDLIRKWLGDEVADVEQGEAAFWNHVPLTGPVLGALNDEKHKTVQDICAESMDRYQSIFWSSANAGRPINKLELAKLRERTRTELTKELNEDQVLEFLLRYSHNAENLRQELRGFAPTPEEFKEIFRATDQMDHHMQLQYGGLEFLSASQRERHDRLRTQAIKEVLAENRFESYLMTKDPLYKQAQSMAMQYGAPSSAVSEIYELTKRSEVRKQEVLADKTLTPQDRNTALQSIYAEQRRLAREIAIQAKPTQR